MTDIDKALAAAREALADHWEGATPKLTAEALRDLLAALDAAREQAVAWQVTVVDNTGTHDYAKWAGLQAPPAAAVPAANVTPMRQPRADLARLVESINAAVYAHGDGLSVTEAVGALELAKLELLKEQEQ